MQFSNVDDWRSDRMREAQGVVCPIGQGRELIVKRAGSRNRAYIAGLVDLKPDDVAAMERLFASTVVCGWRGIRDAEGRELEFSAEACAELFAQCPDLGDHVARFAADRAHFHALEVEEEGERLKVIPGGR